MVTLPHTSGPLATLTHVLDNDLLGEGGVRPGRSSQPLFEEEIRNKQTKNVTFTGFRVQSSFLGLEGQGTEVGECLECRTCPSWGQEGLSTAGSLKHSCASHMRSMESWTPRHKQVKERLRGQAHSTSPRFAFYHSPRSCGRGSPNKPWVRAASGKLKPPGHSKTLGTVEKSKWPRVQKS